MTLLISTIFPIFLLIILGFTFAHLKLISSDIANSLGNYVLLAAGPAIIFSNISKLTISQIFAWKFWIAYLLSILAVTLFAYFLIRLVIREIKIASITSAFSTSIKNTVIIGLPLLTSIIGQNAIIPVVASVVIFNCLISPALIFICELNCISKQPQNTLNTVSFALFSTLKNPLVLSAVLGLIFSYLQIPIPLSINKSLNYLADSFIPCALFAVGVELKSYKLHKNLLKAFIIATTNLILCPIIAIAISYILNLSPIYSVALVILSAMPTAKSMYIYVGKYNLSNQETAATIMLTTFLGLITIPCFIYLSFFLWPSAILQKLI